MPRDDLILFLDLEATGSGDDEDIVEIGCSLLAAPDWNEVSYFSSLVHPDPIKWDRMAEVVVQLHRTSGLYDDMEAKFESIPLASAVDDELITWLNLHVGKDRRSHIPLGGSGITHYDRKFLSRDFPRFNKRVTYYSIDVGSERRIWDYAGVPWSPSYESKTHRALDDARAHAEEFRWVLRMLRGAKQRIALASLTALGELEDVAP